jgi:hypothetical protein
VPPPAKEPPRNLEISDIWHPYRAVKKGLDWAGDQVPAIGVGDAGPRPRAAAPAGPISLLPSAAASQSAEKADARVSVPKPAAPGPGSGGLY